MNWLQSNWTWLVIVAGFVAMHLFGHGGGHNTATAGSRTATP